jgi:hypothetical protein
MFNQLNTMQFIGPLLLLIACMIFVGFLYSRFFSWLPKNIYNYLIGPVSLFGIYIWYGPMKMGFYEFFN